MMSYIRALRGHRPIEVLYAIAWKLGMRGRAGKATQRAIFERIHDTNAWGDPETRSGPGSTRARGAQIVAPLQDLFARHGVTSLLDAPCGDFNWMRDATQGLSSYVGVDIVASLVDASTARYADARHRFACADITADPLPRADLVLCRDAWIHLSFADIARCLANFRRSGTRLLLTTSFIEFAANEDMRTGAGWRRLNLERAPFHFPPPLDCIEDLPDRNVAPDKRLCLWDLSAVPDLALALRGTTVR